MACSQGWRWSGGEEETGREGGGEEVTYPYFLFNRVHVHVWCLGVVFTLYTVSTCFQSLFAIHFDSPNVRAFGSRSREEASRTFMVAERHALAPICSLLCVSRPTHQ